MDTNVILAICQIVAVSITPLIVWFLGNKWQADKMKENAKLSIFLTLMSTRRLKTSQEHVDALNQIDVVFQDNKNVRNAWHDYLVSLDENSQFKTEREQLFFNLLSEIANVLGFKNLKLLDISRVYKPQAISNEHETKQVLNSEWIRVLSHSNSLADAFGDEEYQKHLKDKKILNKFI